MYGKIILPMLIGILVVGGIQFTFAELEKVTYIAVDKEQFEQPQSKYSYQQITIIGYVENYTRGDVINIAIIHPDESQEEINTYATKKGEINTLFQINGDSQIGVHKIILKYNGAELTATSFEILKNQ